MLAAIPAVDWIESERQAWMPAVRQLASEWAEEHRMLRRGEVEQSRIGPWRNANAQYGVGIMDAAQLLPGLEELNIKKAAQVGGSEFCRNILGSFADQDPDPWLLVLPDEKKGREIIDERIIPLFQKTEALARHGTDVARDQSATRIKLRNGFLLWLGYSGSPSSLASHPCRGVLNDETNKYRPWSGQEADPVSLAYQRTKTFEESRLIINLSSPTTVHGVISRLFASSTCKFYYRMRCPRCGQPVKITWQCIRWKRYELPAREWADKIEDTRECWYECPDCHGTFTEREKGPAVRNGFWATDDQIAAGCHIGADVPPGSILLEGLPRRVTRAGFHVPGWLATWVKCWKLAAKFLRAKDNPAALMDFLNSDCGEDFEQRTAATEPGIFERKCQVPWSPGRLPPWTVRLICSVDVQLDSFWFVIRAWGPNLRSRRILHGQIHAPKESPIGWDELFKIAFGTPYPFEDSCRPPVVCDLLGIDSRYRSDEVYTFALRDGRIKPLKGATKPLAHYAEYRKLTYTAPKAGGQFAAYYHLIDTHRCKDWLLESAIAAKISIREQSTNAVVQADLWELNSLNDPVYNRHLSAEHKVLERKGSLQQEVWKPRTGGEAHHNHMLDCESNQRALAFIAQMELIDEDYLAQAASAAEASAGPGIVTPDGRPYLVTDR